MAYIVSEHKTSYQLVQAKRLGHQIQSVAYTANNTIQSYNKMFIICHHVQIYIQ